MSYIISDYVKKEVLKQVALILKRNDYKMEDGGKLSEIFKRGRIYVLSKDGKHEVVRINIMSGARGDLWSANYAWLCIEGSSYPRKKRRLKLQFEWKRSEFGDQVSTKHKSLDEKKILARVKELVDDAEETQKWRDESHGKHDEFVEAIHDVFGADVYIFADARKAEPKLDDIKHVSDAQITPSGDDFTLTMTVTATGCLERLKDIIKEIDDYVDSRVEKESS